MSCLFYFRDFENMRDSHILKLFHFILYVCLIEYKNLLTRDKQGMFYDPVPEPLSHLAKARGWTVWVDWIIQKGPNPWLRQRSVYP